MKALPSAQQLPLQFHSIDNPLPAPILRTSNPTQTMIMESETTAAATITTYPVGGDAADPLFTTGSPNIQAFLAQIADDCNMEDLLLDESLLGPQFAKDTSHHSTIAGLRQTVLQHPVGVTGHTAAATGAEENLAHPWLCCPVTGTGLTQPATYNANAGIGNPGPFAGTDMVEIPHSGSAPPLGFSILSAENFPQEPRPPLVVNAVPEPEPYSTGDSSCPPIAADIGSSSLFLEVNAGAGLFQSRGGGSGGGGALAEAAVPASCKRKKLVCGSSSPRSAPPEFNFLESGVLVQSDPSSTDIQPPTGSTDAEIIGFLRGLNRSITNEILNIYIGEQDGMTPKAVRSYVTTVEMKPDQKTHHGYWKERRAQLYILGDEIDRMEYEILSRGLKEPSARSNAIRKARGFKRTLQFHRYDGTKTEWFMEEYIPTTLWGSDLYMEDLRFRKVYKGPEISSVPDEPTSPEVKIKSKIAAAKRHRMRGPENLVIKGESPVWQHFVKIYDRHPEQEGSKVVYAVCCHCEGVLKADTKNGTNSLTTHCDRTCPVKNKNQQPRSSR